MGRRGKQTRGLSNERGQNNCFLNVIVQSLYHLEDFRVMFDSINWVNPKPGSTFLALRTLFDRLASNSIGGKLSPQVLRDALASVYKKEGKFQISDMDDASEALEKLLAQLNQDINGQQEDAAINLRFPFHLFSTELVYHGFCLCGLSSKATVSTVNIIHVSVEEMRLRRGRFASLLKQTVFSCNKIKCASSTCSFTTQAKCALKRAPPVLGFSLDWSDSKPKAEDIRKTLKTVSTDLELKDAFDNLEGVFPYSLVSMICYYGQHYAAFIRDPGTDMWVYYDDSLVKTIGTTWDAVLLKCETGKWQPRLLLYSRLGDTHQPQPDTLPVLEDDGGWRMVSRSTEDNYLAVQMPRPSVDGIYSRYSTQWIEIYDPPRGRRSVYDPVHEDELDMIGFRSRTASTATIGSDLGMPAAIDGNGQVARVVNPPSDQTMVSRVEAYALAMPGTINNNPTALDRVENLIRSAQLYEHLKNYATARQCYESAADTLMDLVEDLEKWPEGVEDASRRKALSTARRYLSVAEAMDRLASDSTDNANPARRSSGPVYKVAT